MSMPRPVPPQSSLGKSIAAYYPWYPPPAFPQTNYLNSGGQLQDLNQVPADNVGYKRNVGYNQQAVAAGVVNAAFRTYGMGWLYSRGAKLTKWFREIATGQVESTKFQQLTASTWYFAQNGNLYRCGFPRNLGWSEKVPTIPPEALGIDPWQMDPAPKWSRNIFTRRRYSTMPSIPAVPMDGRS